jgi:predicted acyl esterase
VRTQGAWFRISIVAAVIAGVLASGPMARASDNSSPFEARGSARQVSVTGVAGGAGLALLDGAGHTVAAKTADSLGGAVFYDVAPGAGYRVRLLPHGTESAPLTVHSDQSSPWDPSIYGQSIAAQGYGYLTTRDGTTLAIDVRPPTSPAGPPGRIPHYPTLIEYSGYGYANPSGPENGIAVLANLMGFAVVDVNMRGTGCSGGAFNYFEPLQNLDGYDVIETIAHQPWVLGHKVGMMGISYGAISQLFTAQTQPPSLAAISPLSTIDATATTLYPGGILNTGFAVPWAALRQHDAEPAGPNSGQAWAYQRIQQGDQTCQQNQVLHGEAEDLLAMIQANAHYRPNVADPLDPITFVDKIRVPVFMACQWQDEQTGGHCADLVAHFTGTNQKWFTFANGAHVDSLDPDTYNRWYDFLQLYVAHEPPVRNVALTDAAAPIIYQQAMGLPSSDFVTLPADAIQRIPTYAAALAAYEKLPPVRVLFDNGAGASPRGPSTAGNPYPAFTRSFAQFPIPNTAARRWYLGPGGTLTDYPPATAGIDGYTSNANALPLTDYAGGTGGGGLWGNASQWQWNWLPDPSGTAVSYLTSPLTSDVAVIGGGAVDLWVRSSTPDVDLQATISEVDPDGQETFIQNGWIRASERKLATGTDTILDQPSTPLEPIPSMRASDVQPMPPNKFVEVVIPLYFEGHVYRAGTRLRVTIAAPNGTQPVWSFSQTEPPGTADVSIAFSPKQPSNLILPVIPGISAPVGIPPCPSLRNEPCRPYAPITNRTLAS